MSDEKILKPKSFRITDETADAFKQISAEIGGNQQEALAKLIETYEFQKGIRAIYYSTYTNVYEQSGRQSEHYYYCQNGI